MVAEWTGGRTSLSDPDEEAARVAAYWGWLSTHAGDVADASEDVAPASAGRRWVRLGNPADADWEALHMRHSIGYSWGSYSMLGSLYSLRGPDNIPELTVLVRNGLVLHAREQRNARPSPDSEAEIAVLAGGMGWEIQPDRMPFDQANDGEWDDCEMVYLHRAGDGTKTFGSVAMRGHVSDEAVRQMAEALPGGRRFCATWAGFPSLGEEEDEPAHEIVALRDLEQAPPGSVPAERVGYMLVAGASRLATAKAAR